MGKLNEKVTYAYIRNLKRWMFCPACGAKMHIQSKTDTWKCEGCNYTLSNKEFQAGYIFWFCDGCNAFLNKQDGFNLKEKRWICTCCGYKNDLITDNIADICKDCGKALPTGTKRSICDGCRATRIRKAVRIGAKLGGLALTVGTVILATKKSNDTAGSEFDGSVTPDIDYPTCKTCGARMTEFDGWAWYACPECGNSARVTDDGTVTWQNEIFGASSADTGGKTCENCGRSLRRGSYTLPWEDGSNSDGYIKCPHCGYFNFQREDGD